MNEEHLCPLFTARAVERERVTQRHERGQEKVKIKEIYEWILGFSPTL